MAYQEDDEKPVHPARSAARRWLRELLFEDWSLKLLALAITLGLWYGITGQRTPATIRLRGAQLVFLLPNDKEISNDPRDEVTVTLRGGRRALDAISVRDLIVSVDIHRLPAGDHRVPLAPDTVTMELPEDVHLERIEPATVLVRLEQRIERELPVEVRFEGELPAGYEQRAAQVSPNRIRVRGPESQVLAVESAPTEPLMLNGLTESRTFEQVSIDIANRRVVPIDTLVSVRLEVGEVQSEKRLTGIIVRLPEGEEGEAHPARAAVTVRGDRSAVERLRAENLELVLEQTAEGALRPRLRFLLPNLAGRVTLVSTEPAEFSR